MRRLPRLLFAGLAALAVLALTVFVGMKGSQPFAESTAAPAPKAARTAPAPKPAAARDYPVPALTYTWQNFTTKDGLPSNKGHSIRVDGDRVWIGTDAGLVRYEGGKFTTFTEADGLVHPLILSIDVDERTGDVWLGTMGGVNRFSGGRFETYTQLNSGLANDVVYYVAVDGQHVWFTTAAGISRYDTRTRKWDIFNETNTPMHEPWCYAVAPAEDKVYFGIWASGVLELDRKSGVWKVYHDPDGEFEVDLFPNDGPVNDVTSSLAYDDGIVWHASYFGLTRYDGTRWYGYFDHDSGLASNFINFVKASGPFGWVGTDRGLNSFDGKTWHTYKRTEGGGGETLVRTADGKVTRFASATGPAHNYVLGIDFQGDQVWLATEGGVSVGTPARMAQ